jgi:predicted ATP-dependent endonuclease of OLD family
MRLVSFRISNYKGFHDSGEIQLDTGFNVIVGKNDAGKTSLLEALSLQITSEHHHRSLKTLPDRRSPRNWLPEVAATFLISAEEIYDAAVRAYGMSIPVDNVDDSTKAHTITTAFIESISEVDNRLELKYRGDGHVEAALNGVQEITMSSRYQPVSLIGRQPAGYSA